MKILKNTIVTVKYAMSDTLGNIIDESKEPMVYLHGGYGNTLPKIEEALDGKEVGCSVDLQIEPEDAFGDYDAELVKMEPRANLPTPLEVGMQLEGSPDEDAEEGEGIIFTVTDITDDQVVLDGNHPLAGIALRFSMTVEEVRAATPDELSHGHAHGAHGHHHGDDDEGGDSDQFRSVSLH